MNMQEAFDKAYRGITGQGGPSTNPKTGFCMYDSEHDGKVRHCGIGWLLPEGYAKEKFLEGKRITALTTNDVFGDIPAEFLTSLQDAHDGAAYSTKTQPFDVGFHVQMLRVARNWDLNTKVMTNDTLTQKVA